MNLEEAIKESYSIASVLKKLGLVATGGNYRIIHRKIKEQKLDTSHFTGQGHNKGKKLDRPKISLNDILKENSNYQSYKLKNRMLKENRISNKCQECGLENLWNGKPIKLHLDHINGDNTDHRIENLRMLCPNCHSQTETYAGKNKGKNK